MLLRNYDNIVAALSLVSYEEPGGSSNSLDPSNFGDGYITVKDSLGGVVNQSTGYDCSLPMGRLYYKVGSGGFSWISLGSGNTPVAYDDYKLENELSTSQINVNSSSIIKGTPTYNEETKTWTKTMSYDFQAKSDVTVSEIGVYYRAVGYSNRYFLVYREVLDTPVSLTTGQYLRVSITTTVSANPNKPATVSATVETV